MTAQARAAWPKPCGDTTYATRTMARECTTGLPRVPGATPLIEFAISRRRLPDASSVAVRGRISPCSAC